MAGGMEECSRAGFILLFLNFSLYICGAQAGSGKTGGYRSFLQKLWEDCPARGQAGLMMGKSLKCWFLFPYVWERKTSTPRMTSTKTTSAFSSELIQQTFITPLLHTQHYKNLEKSTIYFGRLGGRL